MAWRVAKSLEKLRSQINEAWPERSKSSDGTIGDAAHASRSSDHNPWVKDRGTGVVTGMDITNDKDGPVSHDLALALVASRDKRIKYIISNGQICSGSEQDRPAWKWRKYTGSNPHRKHVHISVKPTKAHYDSTAPWRIENEARITLASLEAEPDDTAPHAAPADAPKTGISEGAKIGAGLGVAGLLSQFWEGIQQAPDTLLQALIAAAHKPAFWVFVLSVGAAVFVWKKRSNMKKA